MMLSKKPHIQQFERNFPELLTELERSGFRTDDDEISAMRMLGISAVVGVLWMVAAVAYWTLG